MPASTRTVLLLASVALLASTPHISAAEASSAGEMAAAVLPLPEAFREGATIMGWQEDGSLSELRSGDGDFVCLADKPGDERFHVACYHQALEPFMARGRELRAEGMEREALQQKREEEITDGTLPMPSGPTALYSLTGPLTSFDAEAGEVVGGTRISVVYIPFATEATTGLPPQPVTPGGPWLMNPGKPWAHIMVVQPSDLPEPEESTEDSD